MTRNSLLVGLLLAGLTMPQSALAGDSAKKALSMIPADAVVFAYVPNIQAVDGDFQQMVTDLQMNMFLQPPQKYTIGGLLAEHFGIGEGLQADGPMVVAIMPFEVPAEIPTKIAIIIPADDPKKLLEAMGGTAMEGGAWMVTLQGQPMQAAMGENRVALSMIPSVAESVAKCEKGMDQRLSADQSRTMDDQDLVIWVDAQKMVQTFRPQINSFMPLMFMGQPAEQAEAAKAQIDKFLDGAESMTVGLSLDKSGVGLRFAMTLQPDSELAKQSKVVTTKESLLTGLPADGYLVAAGQLVDPKQTEESVKALDAYFGMLKEVKGIEAEDIEKIKSNVVSLVVGIRGARVSVTGSPDSADGLFAVNAIIDTTGSQDWLKRFATLIETVKGLGVEDEDFKKAMGFLTHEAKAEEINGVAIDRTKFDVFGLAKADEMDEEDIEKITKLLGKDALVFRSGALDEKTVVVCLGGSSHAKNLMERAKSSDTSLDSDSGIKKVSRLQPQNRGTVVYIAVDHIVSFVKGVAKALGEESPPIPEMIIGAPLAVCGTGGDGWVQLDVLAPTELIVYGKNVAMMMMGGAMAGAPQVEEAAAVDED